MAAIDPDDDFGLAHAEFEEMIEDIYEAQKMGEANPIVMVSGELLTKIYDMVEYYRWKEIGHKLNRKLMH